MIECFYLISIPPDISLFLPVVIKKVPIFLYIFKNKYKGRIEI